MTKYVVLHWLSKDAATMTDDLNRLAVQGWRLHSFTATSGPVIAVLETDKDLPMPTKT